MSPSFLLSALWKRYGHELWEPVRTWLTNLPSAIDGVADELALATGTASCTQVDVVGADAVLDAWAQNSSLSHRMAAAATVSALCTHEETVDDALRRAIA